MDTLKKFAFILSGIALSGTFYACDDLDDNDLEIQEQKVTLTVLPDYSFTAVAPIENATAENWQTFAGASYIFVFDFKANTCAITANDLKYDSNNNVSFTIANLPLNNEADANVRGVKTSSPSAFLTADGKTHTVNNIRLFCLRDPNRLYNDNESAIPAFFLSFTLDETWQIKAVSNENIFFGTTTTTSANDPTNISAGTSARYKLTLNHLTRTAEITIRNPRFIPTMPVDIAEMTFPGIPFTFNDNGIDLSSNNLLPEIQDTPYDLFPISDLSASMVYETSLDLNFSCNSPRVGNWNVAVDATPFALKQQ